MVIRATTRTLFVIVAGAACGATAPRTPPAPAAAGPPIFAITSAAELVVPHVVSSEYSEVRLAASPDGGTLLWGSTDRKGGPGGWNIWMSRRTAAGRSATDGARSAEREPWTAPEPAPFDSDANDFDPAFSPDGRFVYFFSNRPGGFGGDDLYRVAVIGDGFGPAQHLGPEVNTAGDEWAPTPSPDGTQLMFASNRPGAKHDLYVARIRGDGFAPAEPLPGAINTAAADEFDATFLADGSSIVFARSADVENDPIQLYVAVRGAAGYDAGKLLPASVNVAGGYALGPSIDWGDRFVLYFSAVRPEASIGKLDLYRVRYSLDRRPR